MSNKFSSEVERLGVEHQRTLPYNPQWKGLAERVKRPLMDSDGLNLHQNKPPRSFWAEAVNIALHVRNRVTSESNDISCKCVYVQKYEAIPSGEFTVRYKARTVARGFLQIEGVELMETYAPLVKITSVRMILSIAAVQDYHLHQMDVKTSFLNGVLDETVYIEQPQGLIEHVNEDLVCHLSKAIYSLRQALG